MPLFMIIVYLAQLAIYSIGGFSIFEGFNNGTEPQILLGQTSQAITYIVMICFSLMQVGMIFSSVARAQASAKRINEVLDCPLEIEDGNLDITTLTEKGTVEFKNVCFAYPNSHGNVLDNISFKINKGETIAIVGATGCGKTSLVNLITRFYDVTEGEVLVDGVNVKEYTTEALNNKLGYVPQKAVMFTGTVEENVSYGDNGKGNISIEKVKEAIEVAQGKDFVEKMEGSYQAHIARGGTNVSGGQKQRLAIARAIARDPEIYIFDDSFSALDYKTDATLRKELKKYTKDATSMIVAQRIGTIIHADKIVVLDEGECVGIGTHKELLKTCEVYKEIALSQLSEEELKDA